MAMETKPEIILSGQDARRLEKLLESIEICFLPLELEVVSAMSQPPGTKYGDSGRDKDMVDRNLDTSIKDESRTDRQAGLEARLDEALDESFPASDPVAINIETPSTTEPSPRKSSDR